MATSRNRGRDRRDRNDRDERDEREERDTRDEAPDPILLENREDDNAWLSIYCSLLTGMSVALKDIPDPEDIAIAADDAFEQFEARRSGER